MLTHTGRLSNYKTYEVPTTYLYFYSAQRLKLTTKLAKNNTFVVEIILSVPSFLVDINMSKLFNTRG